MAANILSFLIPKSLAVYIGNDSTVRQALEKMAYHRYTAIPVLDGDGRYVGTVTTDDIFKFFIESGSFNKQGPAEETSVTAIMKPNPARPISHETSMHTLIEQVKEHNFVPVVDDRGCFIGIILRRDVLNFLLRFYNDNEDDQGDTQ
ncbi:MAG: CBS domain-containing protein [Clostridia bacterium]|nr:CBS domain-containing protein [Clostridia bacterium]